MKDAQPLHLLQLRTRIIVHAQTAAYQQSNGSYEAMMCGKYVEWKDYFIMILLAIHWVPVENKGSKVLCEKLGAMEITPIDPLHQEYLTINLGNISDWRQMPIPLVRLCERWRGRSWATGADSERGRDLGALSHSLSHSPSQDGLSLEFVAATAGRECNIQDARGGELWEHIWPSPYIPVRMWGKGPNLLENYKTYQIFCFVLFSSLWLLSTLNSVLTSFYMESFIGYFKIFGEYFKSARPRGICHDKIFFSKFPQTKIYKTT